LAKKTDVVIAGINLAKTAGPPDTTPAQWGGPRGRILAHPSMAFSVCKEGFEYAAEYTLMAKQLF